MGPGASGIKDICNPVFRGKVNIIFSGGHCYVCTAGDHIQFCTGAGLPGGVSGIFSIAVVIAPGTVLAELEHFSGGNGNVTCHFPVTFSVHGEIRIPFRAFQRADKSPGAGSELHHIRFLALSGDAGICRVFHLFEGGAVPGEEEGVQDGEVAPELICLIRSGILVLAVVVEDEVDSVDSAESGCLPVCPGIVPEDFGT